MPPKEGTWRQPHHDRKRPFYNLLEIVLIFLILWVLVSLLHLIYVIRVYRHTAKWRRIRELGY